MCWWPGIVRTITTVATNPSENKSLPASAQCSAPSSPRPAAQGCKVLTPVGTQLFFTGFGPHFAITHKPWSHTPPSLPAPSAPPTPPQKKELEEAPFHCLPTPNQIEILKHWDLKNKNVVTYANMYIKCRHILPTVETYLIYIIYHRAYNGMSYMLAAFWNISDFIFLEMYDTRTQRAWRRNGCKAQSHM